MCIKKEKLACMRHNICAFRASADFGKIFTGDQFFCYSDHTNHFLDYQKHSHAQIYCTLTPIQALGHCAQLVFYQVDYAA